MCPAFSFKLALFFREEVSTVKFTQLPIGELLRIERVGAAFSEDQVLLRNASRTSFTKTTTVNFHSAVNLT